MSDISTTTPALPGASVPNVILCDSGITEAVGYSQGPSATVKFLTRWADRYTFANKTVGTAILVGTTVVRIFPLAYPPSPNLYALEIQEIGGIGKPAQTGGWISYPYAAITVRFGIPPWLNDVSGVPWTTTSLEFSGELLTLPQSTYLFADGTAAQTPIGRVIPQVDISFKRHYLPLSQTLLGTITGLVGQVNNATFFGFAAESLLFNGASLRKSADAAGNVTYETEYKFTYRPINWNQVLHPNRTTGFAYVTDGNGNKVYAPGDFTVLP